MPHFSNFNDAMLWVIANGYWIIFLVMCFEGPITTAAAGFAAALGYFDPWIILVLSIAGDLVPDSLYYAIGYQGRLRTREYLNRRLGTEMNRLEKTAELLRKHFNKTIVVLKLTPLATPFGFMLVGALRLSFRRFIGICAAVTVPKSLLFLALGYFFGGLYGINEYLRYAGILFPTLILGSFAVFFIYKKTAAFIVKRLKK